MTIFTVSFVVSNDSTRIGYKRIGEGPGLVIVHGSLSTNANYSELVTELAEHFTVYIFDRRSFGSSPYEGEFCIQQDIEDVAALIERTGVTNLFGYSLGGIIALSAAATLPAIKKLAVYEPPLFPNRESAAPVMVRLDRELERGKLAAVIVTAMTNAHLGLPIFNALPRWLLEFFMRFMMTYGEKEGQSNYVSFRQLAPTLHRDGQIILEISGKQDSFANIKSDTLLFGGSNSSKFLKNALSKLEKIIPGVKRVEIPGLEHGSAVNADMRGKPKPIADELIRFFI